MEEVLKDNIVELWNTQDLENRKLALLLVETQEQPSEILNEFLKIMVETFTTFEGVISFNPKTELSVKAEEIFHKYYVKKLNTKDTVNVDELLK